MKIVLLLGVVASTLLGATSYPQGPPPGQCLSGTPHHSRNRNLPPGNGNEIQETLGKIYEVQIYVSKDSYEPGENLTVTVRSPLNMTYFEGYVLRAVRVSAGPDDVLMGTFSECVTSPGDSDVRPLMVPSWAQTNCVTHKSNAKKHVLSCKWMAPSTAQGSIVFRATLVKDYDEWYQMKSNEISSVNGTEGVPEKSKQELEASKKDVSIKDCGSTRGCILYPTNCAERGVCTYGVTFKEKNGGIEFSMFGNSAGYLALGFSEDRKMGQDEVVICSYDATGQRVVISPACNPMKYNSYYFRKQSEFSAIGGVRTSSSIGFTSETINCQFWRAAYLTTKFGAKTITYGLRQKDAAYAFLAFGVNYDGTYEIRFHDTHPLITAEKVDFSSNKVYYFRGLNKKVQIHALLVTIGWMLLAGCGIVVARHTRPLFTEEYLSKAVWFWVHVSCVIGAFLFGVAGIIYMLVINGKWETGFVQTHGICGCLATGLGLLNIIAGIFRPHPGTKYRHIFNQLHRLNGMLALVFAICAMWIGIFLFEVTEAFRFWGLIILGAWSGVQVLFMIIFECCRSRAVNVAKEEQDFQISMKVCKDSKPINGKMVPHVSSVAVFLYFALVFALCAAFWAGLFLH